ncbi:hypothetical protein ACFO1B_50975 [Dactylosporangium siamense]|nr:hypothetical protein [Dactylosporangium siamense]
MKGLPDNILEGDGTAMAAMNKQFRTGEFTYGQNHLTSTNNLRVGLHNFLTKDEPRRLRKSGPTIEIVRTERDIQVATSLIDAIDHAQAGNYIDASHYPGLEVCDR